MRGESLPALMWQMAGAAGHGPVSGARASRSAISGVPAQYAYDAAPSRRKIER